jgi:hypothetical protein
MKRVVLLGSFLVVFCASPGMAATQSLDGLTDPLEDGVDKVTNPVEKVKDVVDEVKKPVEKALPPVAASPKKPVADVGKAVGTVVKDVTDVANNPSGAAKNQAGGGSDEPRLTPSADSAPATGSASTKHQESGASASRSTAARAFAGSAKGSTGARRARPAGDTEQVAAAGNTIQSGEVKGAQTVAPATDVDEGVGSNLSLTGVQILAWLIAACGLIAAGTAFNLTGRLRLRAARS